MSASITIAVGSTRAPKLRAVEEAFALAGPLLDAGARFEILGFDVASGVRHTPLTREESMQGAKNRVLALERIARERGENWAFLIGLEGGFDVIAQPDSRLVLLENWVCVAGPDRRIAWGRSGAIQVPESLAAEVVDRGVELGIAIDAFASETGIRDAQGAWGVLSRGQITRQDAFRVALLGALAPFFNQEAYRRAPAGALRAEARAGHSSGGG